MAMNERSGDGPPPEQRKRISILLQALGILDIATGVACAVLGPIVLGGDPATDTVWMVAGGALALGGIVIWWFGRFRVGRRADGDHASSVVDRGSP
jgi:hypothetical protein